MSSDQQFRDSIRSNALAKLQSGFLSDQDIARHLGDYASDSMSDFDLELDDDTLNQLVSEELAAARKAHRAEMAAWPEVTDCDRLDAAFTELNAMGIMARHNWTCCGTCGVSQMPDEHRRLGGWVNGKLITGYVFYHQQGTENAVDSAGVHINYGSTLNAASEAEYERQSVAIARTACDVLSKHGLTTIWDGSYERRPCIKLDWKRRGVPKDYVDSDGDCNGAPATAPIDVIEPAPTGAGKRPPLAASATPEVAARPMRTVDKLASYAITAISVLAAIAVVIAVAFVGVPIGDWVIHSIWLALVLGLGALFVVGIVLAGIAKLIGINAQPFGSDNATPSGQKH